LKGKVKITVIATGFGAPATVRASTPASSAATPVDMTQYADYARMRNDTPAPASTPASAALPRMSIARRPLLDLPMAASGGGAAMTLASSAATPPAKPAGAP